MICAIKNQRFTGTIDKVSTRGEISLNEVWGSLWSVPTRRWYDGQLFVEQEAFRGRELGQVCRLKAEGVVEIDVRLSDWFKIDSREHWLQQVHMPRILVEPSQWKPVFVFRFTSQGPPQVDKFRV